MKIERLRLENLNALTGGWCLDFAQFAAGGVFAITGATGSGKTTVLDALTLALYGRTPRLARIGKNGNALMSQGRGFCLAEVTFRTPEGQFCALWSQHRAKKSPTGSLQNPVHELRDAAGVLLARQSREVLPKIAALTGLDYVRFTRSVLLAQGAFAAFLQAPADERASLLEQITATEEYSRLSIYVHQRERESREQHQRACAEDEALAARCVADPEALARQIAEDTAREQAQTAQMAQAATYQAWAQQRQKLCSALARAEAARLPPQRRRWAEAADTLPFAALDAARAAVPDPPQMGPARARAEAAEREAQVAAAALAALEARRPTLERLWQDAERCQQWPELQQRVALAKAETATAQRALAKARQQLRAQEAHAEAVLQQLRTQLQEGTPCPLCGARHHPQALPSSPPPCPPRATGALPSVPLEALERRWQEAWQAQMQAEHALAACPPPPPPHCPRSDFETQWREAQAQLVQLQKRATQARQAAEHAEASYAVARRQYTEAQAHCAQLEHAGAEAARAAGFADLEAARAARLSAAERQGAQTAEQQWQQAQEALQRWEACAPAVVPVVPEHERQALRTALAHHLAAQAEDARARAARQTTLHRRRYSEQQWQKWRALDALIGAADGKKFRLFAQGLTLARLLRLANAHLLAMGSRYRLAAAGLGSLLVEDAEQDGARRAIENLSGGESFLLSLALALGLSQMASARVQVESLFLDEGFGSLDEDALNAALTALTQLRRRGTVIGIISHVEALKERVATHLRVEPQGGGQSRLIGPGVTYSATFCPS